MGEKLEEAALGIGGGIVNATIGQGLGMVFGKSQDRRQLRQQEKLQALQMKGNKEMADYTQGLQMDMWNKTNAGAQMEHYKKAGLNPALIYGMSGGGGVTTGGANAGSVNGGNADGASAGVGMGMQLASQVALTQAQTENIKADTKNKLEGAGKTAEDTKGVVIDNEVKEATKYDAIGRIKEDARRAMAEADNALTNSIINEESHKEKIQGIKAEAAGEALKNILTKENIKLTDRKIWEISEKIAQGWKSIEFQGTDKVLGKYIEQVADMMKGLGGK